MDFENQLNYSMSINSETFQMTSRVSQAETLREIRIEVLDKLSVKDSYDLKKIIHNLHLTINELKLPETYFEVNKTDFMTLNDK